MTSKKVAVLRVGGTPPPPPPPPDPPEPPAPTLLSSLIAYWSCNEEGGTRADSHENGYHLSASGTVGTATGLVYPKAALFDMTVDGALSRLRAASPLINFDSSTPYTFAAWLYLTSESGGPDTPTFYRYIMGMNGGSSFGGGYQVFSTSGKQLFMTLGKTGGPPQYSRHLNLYLTLDTWSLFTWSHDAGALTWRLDGASDSDTNTYPFVAANSGDFFIGAKFGNLNVWDGRMGPIMFFNKALDATEYQWLYNGGAGQTYAAFT
jgi:hypothetical protein